MVLEDVFSDENLEEAFESFADKHDSHGLDGVKLSELRAYWETNGKKIKESIFNGTYKVGAVEQRQIVNRKTGLFSVLYIKRWQVSGRNNFHSIHMHIKTIKVC